MQRLHDTCTVDGCARPHKSRGYCQTHYMQFRRGVAITPVFATRVRDKLPECQEAGCHEPVKSRGMCHMHYQRYLRHGHTRYRDRKREPKICSIPGCDNILYANTVCHAHYIKARRWQRYGIDALVYIDMLAKQGGGCAICGRSESATDGASGKIRDLSIDHCHTTNVVRGLLCSACNRGIGLLQDNPDTLRKAAAYLDVSRG